MDEKSIIKEKSNNLETLSLFLRITSIICFTIGLYLILKNNHPSQTQSPRANSEMMYFLTDIVPIIVITLSTIIGLAMLILAYTLRKTATKPIIIGLIIIGILLPVFTWFATSKISKSKLQPIITSQHYNRKDYNVTINNKSNTNQNITEFA